jgi:hypothetical protein
MSNINMIDYPKYLSRLPLSFVDRFKSVHMLWRTILVVLILSSYPYHMNAFSQCNVKGDIPFQIRGTASELVCLGCKGPWGRASAILPIPEGPIDPPCTFYAAEKTLFSPYGLWECSLRSPIDNGCTLTGESVASVVFCVQPAPADADNADNTVYLFTENNKLSVEEPAPPCSSSVASFLGDNPKQEKSKRDSDEFLFDGAGGDQVTLRLETNPREGNNGGQASLGIRGNSLNESTSGTPPLELDVTLPGDGEYSITVEQPRRPKDQRFRGSYILSLTPSIGSIDLIEPTNNVEK